MDNIYLYDGPIMHYNKLVSNRWVGETRAISENKARSNLQYQFKKDNNMMAATKITLAGKVVVKGENNEQLQAQK